MVLPRNPRLLQQNARPSRCARQTDLPPAGPSSDGNGKNGSKERRSRYSWTDPRSASRLGLREGRSHPGRAPAGSGEQPLPRARAGGRKRYVDGRPRFKPGAEDYSNYAGPAPITIGGVEPFTAGARPFRGGLLKTELRAGSVHPPTLSTGLAKVTTNSNRRTKI